MAEIVLAEHKPLDAVQEIWKGDSLPDGPSGSCGSCKYADLGRAYDQANMPDSAIKYWELHIATPFAEKEGTESAVLAGIHKRLGELYEKKGDVGHAMSRYESFVALRKNADPELQPQVTEVKRRLDRLMSADKR